MPVADFATYCEMLDNAKLNHIAEPAINPTSMTTGAHTTQISANTVRGTTASSSPDSNVEVDFQTPIDTLAIRHYDVTSWTAFQWIGIHDFHWC